MKLSAELIAEMAGMSKMMKVLDDETDLSVVSIDERGVHLSFEAFVSTFETYVTEKRNNSEYTLKYKAVVGGVLFYTVTNEAEVIAHIERSKYND